MNAASVFVLDEYEHIIAKCGVFFFVVVHHRILERCTNKTNRIHFQAVANLSHVSSVSVVNQQTDRKAHRDCQNSSDDKWCNERSPRVWIETARQRPVLHCHKDSRIISAEESFQMDPHLLQTSSLLLVTRTIRAVHQSVNDAALLFQFCLLYTSPSPRDS